MCQTRPGEVAAFGEFCPHLAAPMEDGWADRGRLVCPWHGSWFATESGDVVRGPAAAPLPCYEARLVNGMVEVRGEAQQVQGGQKGMAIKRRLRRARKSTTSSSSRAWGWSRSVNAPVNSEERHALFDEMLVELDIHFRIEDDFYYPALKDASKLIAVAHAEHRQVVDQLSAPLRTPQSSPGYEDEWNSFKTVLEVY